MDMQKNGEKTQDQERASQTRTRRARRRADLVGYLVLLVVFVAGGALVTVTATLTHDYAPAVLLGTLAVVTLIVLVSRPIASSLSQVRGAQLRAFTAVLIALIFGAGFITSGVMDSGTRDVVSYTLVSIYFLAVAVFVARSAFDPLRRQERERHQKLLAAIEALAEDNPGLYAVAQLVRDDIAVSNRSSSRQSLLQNLFFFALGATAPYILQYLAPTMLNLLNVR
jgi:hypothetical protein